LRREGPDVMRIRGSHDFPHHRDRRRNVIAVHSGSKMYWKLSEFPVTANLATAGKLAHHFPF
jgi:hypothetical protein